MKKILVCVFCYLLALLPGLQAASVKEAFGSGGVTISCSLAPSGVGLASGSARASASVDNSTNLYLDALVFVKVKTNSTGVSAGGSVNFYAYGSVNGTDYSDGATGADAPFTMTSPTNARMIGICNTPATSTTYSCGPFSVASAFGGPGNLPSSWGIIIQNSSGAALDATEANHTKIYQGVYATVAQNFAPLEPRLLTHDRMAWPGVTA